MENTFIKCECHTHGMDIEIFKNDENPNNAEFIFSMWKYGKKTKPSFKQRWKYFWTGNNDIIGDSVIMDINKTKEMSKFLISNLDKINLDIKKFNSSDVMIKNLIKKTEDNLQTIFKRDPEKNKIEHTTGGNGSKEAK